MYSINREQGQGCQATLIFAACELSPYPPNSDTSCSHVVLQFLCTGEKRSKGGDWVGGGLHLENISDKQLFYSNALLQHNFALNVTPAKISLPGIAEGK